MPKNTGSRRKALKCGEMTPLLVQLFLDLLGVSQYMLVIDLSQKIIEISKALNAVAIIFGQVLLNC